LDSFLGQPAELKDYDGILTVKKLSAMNSLINTSQSVDSLRYFFKSTRRKFVIEKISLPPEDIHGLQDRPEQAWNKTLDLTSCSSMPVPRASSTAGKSHTGSKLSNLDF